MDADTQREPFWTWTDLLLIVGVGLPMLFAGRVVATFRDEAADVEQSLVADGSAVRR
jgi:hypothetical protein